MNRRYYWFRRSGVPFPGVVLEDGKFVEGCKVVANILYGTWSKRIPDQGFVSYGTTGQVSVLTDKLYFGYASGSYVISAHEWQEVSRDEFKKRVRALGYKKCLGRNL